MLINQREEAAFEEELVQDALEIITVFPPGCRDRGLRGLMRTENV
jgi:hypothetical protein